MKKVASLFATVLMLGACGGEKEKGATPDTIGLGCEESGDCSCPEGYDSAVCGLDGICYCTIPPKPPVTCQRNGDCAEVCWGYDSYSCADGACLCEKTQVVTETVEVPKACVLESDCSCPAGYGMATCGMDGICYCAFPPDPPVMCQEDGNCADGCQGYDSYSCIGGACRCERTQTVVETVEVQKLCSFASDCVCPDGYGAAVCGSDGLCYCEARRIRL